MNTKYFEYLAACRVQCPKCGNVEMVPLHTNTGFGLEYFGVCESVIDTGGRCGTTLVLKATSHLFPAQTESPAVTVRSEG